jgi:hypothetical protein
MLFSGAWGKLIHEKNLKQKSRDTVPLILLFTAKMYCKVCPKRPFSQQFLGIFCVGLLVFQACDALSFLY